MSLQAAYLKAHPDVAAVGSHILYIDPEGRPLRTLRYPTGPDQVASALQSHNALAQPAIMIRRSVALAVGGYRGAFKFGAEDYDLWLRMSESHAVDNLPEVLTHYRIHGESITHTRRADQLIAAFAAMCSARRRRNGQADPVDGQDTPITEADLVRYRLEPDERASFLRIRLDILRLREAPPEDYLELLAQSWELRPYLRRGRHVRHILMPAAFMLLRLQRPAAGLAWIGRAMTREPLSATWLMLRQSFGLMGLGRKSA
jgi:hypothetical protein